MSVPRVIVIVIYSLAVLEFCACQLFFERALDSRGISVCAADRPSLSVYLDSLPRENCASPAAQCALQCRQQSGCSGYNYRPRFRRCELFLADPKTCSVEHGCSYYQILGQSNCANTGTPTALPLTTGAQMMSSQTEAVPVTIAPSSSGAPIVTTSTSSIPTEKVTDTSSPHGSISSPAATVSSTVGSTLLPALMSTPVCYDNTSDEQVLVGEYAAIECSVNYTGSSTPSITWFDSNGNTVVNATAVVSANQVTSYILIQGLYPTVNSFTCRAEMPGVLQNCTTQALTVVCPSGFQFLSGAANCYNLALGSFSWAAASTQCNSLMSGAYTAMITSDAEQSAVNNYLQSCFAQSGSFACVDSTSSDKSAWTCGQLTKPPNCQSGFSWKPASSVSPVAVEYTSWASGQPSGCSASTLTDSIAVVDRENCSWVLKSSSATFCALCEFGPYDQ